MKLKRYIQIATVWFLTSQACASDACQAVLCLAGKLQDRSGGAYFSIVRFTMDGGFDPDQTALARLAFLKGCTSATPEWIERINAAFGSTR